LTPALVLYLIDVSHSMGQPLGDRTRIEVVRDALHAALMQMVFRSTRGDIVLPRYRIRILSYSDDVFDLLPGTKTIDQVIQMGTPPLKPTNQTNTAKALEMVRTLLEQELPVLARCPAPLVCHLTDGEFSGPDPESNARKIMELSVPDGNVLLENIFISDHILSEPVADIHRWQGVLPSTRLDAAYAAKLRQMSSPIPESYRKVLLDSGFQFAAGARLMFPGSSPELVSLGFQMSTISTMGG
jgi:hypothetical protein